VGSAGRMGRSLETQRQNPDRQNLDVGSLGVEVRGRILSDRTMTPRSNPEGRRPGSAGLGQRDEWLGLGADRVGVEEAFEPRGRQSLRAVAGAEQGAGHGGVRVGVAAE
jgi:hypothetical protein